MAAFFGITGLSSAKGLLVRRRTRRNDGPYLDATDRQYFRRSEVRYSQLAANRFGDTRRSPEACGFVSPAINEGNQTEDACHPFRTYRQFIYCKRVKGWQFRS
jgi:hypothetical protein